MNTLTMNRKRGRTENEDDGGAAAAVTPSVQPSKKTKFGTLIKKDKRQILTEPHPDDNPNSKHEDTSRLHGDEDGGGGSAVVSEDPMAQDMGQLSDEVGEAPHDVKKVSKVKKVLQAEKLKRLKEDYDRRGVVYVSRWVWFCVASQLWWAMSCLHGNNHAPDAACPMNLLPAPSSAVSRPT